MKKAKARIFHDLFELIVEELKLIRPNPLQLANKYRSNTEIALNDYL
jgi:hypothetical protein